MDSNIFEKYAFDRLQMLERENSVLKERLGITDLKTRNNTIKLVLGEVYSVNTYDWQINEHNFLDYEAAIEKKDFKWLAARGFKILKNDFNIYLTINDMTFYLKYSNSQLTVVEGFLSLDFAEEELLRSARQSIDKLKQKGEEA